MYALTDRVNQLFFGILLLDEQLKQNSLLQEDLGRTHKQVADYIANGIATPSDLDAGSTVWNWRPPVVHTSACLLPLRARISLPKRFY